MSTDPIDGQQNAEVVPLRATDAGTETHTAESPRAAYTDLSDGRAQRKPIIPAHWRTWEAAREHVKLAAARYGHAAAYHGLRLPAYLVLTSWWALVGVMRTFGMLLAWWHVPDLHKLERQAAADGLLSDHLRIHKGGEGNPHRAGPDPGRLRGGGGGRAGHPGHLGAAVGVDPARHRRAAAAGPHRTARAQADPHPRGAARHRPAAHPGRDHPRAGRAGHRRHRPVAARRAPAGVPVPGARGRPGLARRA